jgi:hypothetical protein
MAEIVLCLHNIVTGDALIVANEGPIRGSPHMTSAVHGLRQLRRGVAHRSVCLDELELEIELPCLAVFRPLPMRVDSASVGA